MESRLGNAAEAAERCNVPAWRVVPGLAHDLNGGCAREAAVADFQGQIVEQPREAELVPLHPMVQRDEVVVDIGIGVVAGTRRLILAEAMRARHTVGLL